MHVWGKYSNNTVRIHLNINQLSRQILWAILLDKEVDIVIGDEKYEENNRFILTQNNRNTHKMVCSTGVQNTL